MKIFKLILSAALLIASVILCQHIIGHSIENQKNKKDYAELNHIRYGIFSVEAWKDQLSHIIADEINNLNLTNANERDLKKHVEIQLGKLIDNVEKRIEESNEGSTKGWIKQSFINTFINMKDIKKGIPEYADTIVKEMTKAQTEDHLKKIVSRRIEKYFDKTFEDQNLNPLREIFKRTGTTDVENARLKVNKDIVWLNEQVYFKTIFLIIISIILFIMPGFSKQTLSPSMYFFLLFSLVVLLIAGVTTPMIDMEAKITKMSFFLLGHPIHFENQVLYFQSKSILDVFWVMVTHKDIEMKLVGILMVCFSIVFPLIKMFSSMAYYYNYRGARISKMINFFVMKSGKWSMADVMVVAIFMAYIGFNGIISSQFGNLDSTDKDLVILSTNGTSLQPGYYLFLAYSILAIFLSGFLAREPKEIN